MDQLPIGYRLKRTFHAFNDSVKRKVHQSGINFTTFYILTFLNKNLECGNREITQKDICKFISLKAPTISITLQNMEIDGYIIRTKSQKDSRNTFVQLTEKGIELANKMKQFFQETDVQIVNIFTQDEYQSLCLLLDKVYKYLKEDN
ncbi:MAG: MarR family winged helix-turn-helix transcriptional regulator [Bacilli bacterium]